MINPLSATDKPDIYPMKVHSDGRCKIPSKLLKKYGIQDGDTILYLDKNNEIRIVLKEEYLRGAVRTIE